MTVATAYDVILQNFLNTDTKIAPNEMVSFSLYFDKIFSIKIDKRIYSVSLGITVKLKIPKENKYLGIL